MIISDNSHQADHIIMANDGYGHLVYIPSIYISELDGNNIIDVFIEVYIIFYINQSSSSSLIPRRGTSNKN